MNMGAPRASQSGFAMASGQYPDPWTPPMLSEMPLMTLEALAAIPPTEEEKREEQDKAQRQPPLELPAWLRDTA